MTTLLKSLFAAALAVAASNVIANEAHHPDASAPTASTKPATTPRKVRANKVLDAQMKKMQAAQVRMLSAKTPEERQAAMQAAMQTMKDGMAMMKNMRMDSCLQRGRSTSSCTDSMSMMQGDEPMMDMMMKMMDQQSSMLSMPMNQ
ncbi:hypothetical protein [Aquitalea pelogenes]|uniref:hypothetical protein n=1 Tax=Aquitalea pelogenes TaxID=1293573 RepID=UPI0035B0DDD8